MARCDHCPRSGPCFGERHRRVCDLRDPSHPDHEPSYTAPMPGEDGFTAVSLSFREPPPPTDTVPLAVALAVQKCQDRTTLPACGCAGRWRCGRYARDVTFPECLSCKAREASESQPKNTVGPTP